MTLFQRTNSKKSNMGGRRTRIIVQGLEVRPARPDVIQKAREIYGPNANTVTCAWKPYVLALTEEINTKEKLMHFVWRNYGVGVYHVCFLDQHHRNKKFRPTFTCTPLIHKKCKHTATCKIGPERYTNKKGCWRNPKFKKCVVSRAMCKIDAIDSGEPGRPYKATWLPHFRGKRRDYMSMFWFWKGASRDDRLVVDGDGVPLSQHAGHADALSGITKDAHRTVTEKTDEYGQPAQREDYDDYGEEAEPAERADEYS